VVRTKVLALVVAVLAAAVVVVRLTASPAGSPTTEADVASAAGPPPQAGPGLSHRPVCPRGGPPGQARCHAQVVTRSDGVTPDATTGYRAGYKPADLASAYKYSLPAAGSAWAWNGKTIAVVDAYDNPSAASDLTSYRSQFALPACTTVSGCFTKVNQVGAPTAPAANVGWGQEIALDLDMASAVCPECKLVLIEANSASMADLATAVDTAANVFHATAISNSYGGNEFGGETTYETHCNHPGSAITVSTGDSGYGVQFPASSRYVTAVGGTHLTRNTAVTRGWSETAWSGAGSGCSTAVAKPSWQTDTGCSRRTAADVSAVADPNTGVAIYDSYGSSGGANWFIFGGTSASAPIVAAIYALAGNAASVKSGSYPYSHKGALFDVRSGTNGSCGSSYLCTAKAGYDGPTGLGTPNGIGAF